MSFDSKSTSEAGKRSKRGQVKIYSEYYDLNIRYLWQIKKYKMMIFSSLSHLFLQLTTDFSLN